jgi:ATP-dependent Clp protease ATP-binding subunit ClpA
MENYSDPSSVSKLIGTSPGYIGYESDSYLFENIKKNPSSVIILDEIEKASNEVVNVFLNIFDEGYFIDSKKRKIDFRNSIIIMTSNLGFNNDKSSLGFNKIETNKEELDKLLKRFFKEELLNRIDDTFYFNKIEKDDYFKIARNYINEFGLDIDSGEILSKISYNSDGIRVLKKNIKNLINNEIIKTKNIKTKVS